MEKPDIYILIGDCLRAANVDKNTMPFITSMSDISAKRYYSTSTWSLPSHASLYTMADPLTHGQVDIDGYVGKEQALLPKIARSEGYTTALFSENSVFGPFRGFDNYIDYCDSEINYKLFSTSFSPIQSAKGISPEEVVKNGFEVTPEWISHVGNDLIQHPNRIKNAINLIYGAIQRFSNADPTEYPHNGDRIVDHFVKYAEKDGGKKGPILSFVNIFDPHNPHHSPPPKEGAEPLGLDITDSEARALAEVSAMDVMLSDPELPPSVSVEFDSWTDVYDRQKDIYNGQIRYTDWLVSQIADSLPTLFDDALVIFIGDHGHLFYEDGLIGHHTHLHPAGIRVPLFVSVPHSWSDIDHTVEGPISHPDVARAISKVTKCEITDSDEFINELDKSESVIVAADGLKWDTQMLYEKYNQSAVDALASKRVGVIRDDRMIEYQRVWNGEKIKKTKYKLTDISREVIAEYDEVESYEDSRIEDWIQR